MSRRIYEVERSPSGRGIELRDTYDSAKQIREVFQGKLVESEEFHNFSWPKFVRYLGRTNAENYFSNKMLSGGKWEFYKHIAEGPQYLFVNDAITTLANDNGEAVEIREVREIGRSRRHHPGRSRDRSDVPKVFYARSYEITGPMPARLADLAPSKGVQWVDAGGKYFEARVPHSMLAAARHPETQETMLVIYSKEGMHFLVTGPKLDVTADGIVG